GRLHHLTDEPAERGRLGLDLLHLVGVGGDDGVDGLLDGARVRDLAQAALLDDVGRVAALGPDDLEQVLGDLAGDGTGGDEIDDGPELGGDTGLAVTSSPSLLSRPNSSLTTQLAAVFPSRPSATASKKSALSFSAVSTPAS